MSDGTGYSVRGIPDEILANMIAIQGGNWVLLVLTYQRPVSAYLAVLMLKV